MARDRSARGPRKVPNSGGAPASAFRSCYICEKTICGSKMEERALDGVIVYLHRYHVARFEARQRAKARAAALWVEMIGGSK